MISGLNLFLPIAIDAYDGKPWPPLKNAKIDAKRLGEILISKYGFELYEDYIFDHAATWDTMHTTFDNVIGRCMELDNLIIYFAGHGEVRSEEGHWIPIDGHPHRYWFSNSEIFQNLKLIQAKHILVIADCCFSGTMTLKQNKLSGLNLDFAELESLKSRILFASGEVTKVSDGKEGLGSPFSKSLCEVLDSNTQPIINSSKIIYNAARLTEGRSSQRPQACQLAAEENENGEMLFRLNLPPTSSETPPVEKTRFPLPELPQINQLIPRSITSVTDQNDITRQLWSSEFSREYLDDIIVKDRQIVLLGGAGSGKSVEALRLAHFLQPREQSEIPIFKRLNAYEGGTITDYLGIDLTDLDTSRLIIFFDGLDEIQPEYFQSAVAEIRKLSAENLMMGLVITCRTNFFDVPNQIASGTFPGFSAYYLNDISSSDVLKHCNATLKIDGDDFLTKVHQNSYNDLLSKPFFLNILLNYYTDTHNLSITRSKILELTITKYYEHNQNHLEADYVKLTKEEVFVMLERLAYIMEVVGKNYITDGDLHLLFPEEQQYNQCKYLPALNYNADSNQWMFDHNNIQEYLAARVLAKLSFEKLTEIITVSSAGDQKIKPSWVHTVSFLISIANDELRNQLLDWLVNNDIEIIVKFEPDRLNDQQKVSVFKHIFDFYNEKGIWISSNKFSSQEFSHFANYRDSLIHLIGTLEDKESSRIAKLNAIHTLFNVDLTEFEDLIVHLRVALLSIIRLKLFTNPSDVHSVIGLLAHLKIADKETVNYLTSSYEKSQNQYLRAGLYKLLANSGEINEYLYIILEGLDLNSIQNAFDDREDTNLMDESFNLKLAIEQIIEPVFLQEFVSALIDSQEKRRMLLNDYRDVFPKLIVNAVNAFQVEPTIYKQIRDLYLAVNADFNPHVLKDIAVFFEKTNTKPETLLFIWKKTDTAGLGWDKLTLNLLDEEAVDLMIGFVKNKDLDIRQIQDFHLMLFYKQNKFPGLVELLEVNLKAELDIELKRPQVKNWDEIQHEQNQINFDLLFDTDALIADISLIFSETKKHEIGREDLKTLMFRNYDATETKISQTTFRLVREFAEYQPKVNLEQIVVWIKTSQRFKDYQIHQIKTELKEHKEIRVKPDQLSFIQDWSLNRANSLDLLWFFLHRFDLPLKEEQIILLSRYANSSVDSKVEEPGTIEMLEKYISKEKLLEAVAENVKNEDIEKLPWLINASYALRNDIENLYTFIIERLKTRDTEHFKDDALLQFWFQKTKDHQGLREFIVKTQSLSLKWTGIKILKSYPEDQDFVKEILKAIMNNDAYRFDERQEAANHLIELNDNDGFYFLADFVLTTSDPNIDFRHGYRSFARLTSIEIIDTLFKLLHLSKLPAFKADVYNDLESVILSAIISVGIQSDESAVKVIDELKNFIAKYTGELDNLNFLHYTIARIQEQIKIDKGQNVTIEQALAEYEGLELKA